MTLRVLNPAGERVTCPNCHEPHGGLYSHDCPGLLSIQRCGCFHDDEEADAHVSRDCFCFTVLVATSSTEPNCTWHEPHQPAEPKRTTTDGE